MRFHAARASAMLSSPLPTLKKNSLTLYFLSGVGSPRTFNKEPSPSTPSLSKHPDKPEIGPTDFDFFACQVVIALYFVDRLDFMLRRGGSESEKELAASYGLRQTVLAS